VNKTRNAIPGVVAAILAVGAGMASLSAVAQTAPGGPPPGGSAAGGPRAAGRWEHGSASGQHRGWSRRRAVGTWVRLRVAWVDKASPRVG
jgi:hypothetical protein